MAASLEVVDSGSVGWLAAGVESVGVDITDDVACWLEVDGVDVLPELEVVAEGAELATGCGPLLTTIVTFPSIVSPFLGVVSITRFLATLL